MGMKVIKSQRTNPELNHQNCSAAPGRNRPESGGFIIASGCGAFADAFEALMFARPIRCQHHRSDHFIIRIDFITASCLLFVRLGRAGGDFPRRMPLRGRGSSPNALVARDVCKVNLKSIITDHSHLNLIKSPLLWPGVREHHATLSH